MTAALSGLTAGVALMISPAGEITSCPDWTTTSFPSGVRRCQIIPTVLLWPSAAVTAGVPAGRETGFHQLRHYFASAALANGVDIRSLAAYLGHTDPGFTLRMYVHLMPDADDRLRLAIDRVFTSSDGPATAREAGR